MHDVCHFNVNNSEEEYVKYAVFREEKHKVMFNQTLHQAYNTATSYKNTLSLT